jgi:two-component system, response regulator PdtaR
VAFLEKHPKVAAVVTDIEMPGSMDGLALGRAIRERWPACSLVMTSGHRGPRPDQMPAGARFLSKPFLMRSLQRELEELGVRG